MSPSNPAGEGMGIRTLEIAPPQVRIAAEPLSQDDERRLTDQRGRTRLINLLARIRHPDQSWPKQGGEALDIPDPSKIVQLRETGVDKTSKSATEATPSAPIDLATLRRREKELPSDTIREIRVRMRHLKLNKATFKALVDRNVDTARRMKEATRTSFYFMAGLLTPRNMVPDHIKMSS